MKKKLIPYISVLSTVCLIAACNKGGGSEPVRKDYVTINGFDSDEEFLRFRKTNRDSTGNVDYRLNNNKDYIVEGKGSLKYSVDVKCDNELVFPFYEEDKALFDTTDLSSFNFLVYSEANESLDGRVYLFGLSKELISYNFTVSPKSWNNIEFKVPGLLIETFGEEIDGAAICLETTDSYVSYLDEVRVKLGAHITEEEEQIKETIEALKKGIDELPENVRASDFEQVKTYYDLYNLIPQEYQALVTNAYKIYTKLQDLGRVIPESLEVKSGQELLGFDKLYGQYQLSVNGQTEVEGTSIEYTKDMRYGDEEGSTEVKFVNASYTYLNLLRADVFNKYDTITINIYNYSETGFVKRVYYNDWKSYVDLPSDEWAELTIKVSEFFASPLAITEINEGTASACTGSFYFSRGYGLLKHYTNIGMLLDETTPAFKTGVESTLSVLPQHGFKITAQQDGDVNVRFNKAILEVDEEDSIYLVMNATNDISVDLLGFDGNVVRSLSLKAGNTKIEMSAKEYSLVFAFKTSLLESESVSVLSFFAYEQMFKNAAYVIASYATIPSLEDLSLENVCSVVEFIDKYESLGVNEQEIVKTFKVDIQDVVDAYKAELVSGGASSLINDFVRAQLDTFASTNATPYLLLALSDLEFVCDNLSQGNKDGLDAVLAMYGIAFGENKDSFYKGYDYGWSGNVSRYIDSNYGNVYNFDVTSFTAGMIQLEFGAFAGIEEFVSLSFELYNPTNDSKACQFYTQQGPNWVLVTEFTLKPNSWQHVELDASKVTNPRNFLLIGNHKETSGYIMTPLVGGKKSAMVGSIIAEISKLPQVIENDDKLTKATVLSLVDQYNNLTTELKELITNYKKLETLYTEYCQNMEIAIKAQSSTYTGLLSSALDTYTTENKGHGYYSSGRLLTDGADKEHHNFLIAQTSLLNKLATEYDRVTFYIYVPSDCPDPYFFSQYSIGWAGPNMALVAGEWNEITISGDEFYNHNSDHSGMMAFYVKGQTNDLGTGEWKITSFYGYND